MVRSKSSKVGGLQISSLLFFATTAGIALCLSATALADPCVNIDCCSESIACKNQGGIWVTVVPAEKKLYNSGPMYHYNCVRLVWDNPNCVNPNHRDDYGCDSCGATYVLPPGG